MNEDKINNSISVIKEDNAANLQGTAETAEADEEIKAAADLGKFKDAGALLAAYKALEAEFTRRSQRLKELEEGNKVAHAGGAPSPRGAEIKEDKGIAALDETVKKAIIEDYLKSVAERSSVPVISGGISAAAPKNAPKTVKEAGALAETFLKNIK